MSRESSLWNWLSKARRDVHEPLFMTRIENAVSAGMPDVEGIFRGAQFWLELKSIERPMRSATKLRFKIREAQVHWLGVRWLYGGIALFLLQVGSGSSRILYLIPACLVSRLAAGMTEAELAAECTAMFKQPISYVDFLATVISSKTTRYRQYTA